MVLIVAVFLQRVVTFLLLAIEFDVLQCF